jgi:hypothetical protein
MFKKSKLSFKNILVFEKGFRPSIDNSFCVVSKMMFFNRINVDGTINVDQASYLRKRDLWSYIYYLYYYNNSSVEEFAMMKNKTNGKANAVLFYKSVQNIVQNQFINNDEILPFDVNTLIYFINVICQKYGVNLRNPVVDYLRAIMNNKDAIAQLQNFTLVTGRNPGNVVVVTKPEEIANANIKVNLNYRY